MEGLSVAQKNELLFERGINFNDLPTWQKRGVGLYWEDYQKEGYNPVTEETVLTMRSRIRRDLELPMKDEYDRFIEMRITCKTLV
jgi:tRNA(His) guanylyltransferase